MEIWKQIPGFGEYYEASSLGNIRSLDRIVLKKDRHSGALMKQFYPGRILKPKISSKLGHLSVHIGVNGRKYSLSVHRAVLMAFLGMPIQGHEACHCNGIAGDNKIENLRWDTHANNNRDRKLHGTYPLGSKHPMAKLNENDVMEIRQSKEKGTILSKKYGVGPSTISRIRLNKNWSFL